MAKHLIHNIVLVPRYNVEKIVSNAVNVDVDSIPCLPSEVQPG